MSDLIDKLKAILAKEVKFWTAEDRVIISKANDSLGRAEVKRIRDNMVRDA